MKTIGISEFGVIGANEVNLLLYQNGLELKLIEKISINILLKVTNEN